MEPGAERRILYVIGRLLDEVLKDFLWRCRVELARFQNAAGSVAFLPRPPELISLAGLASGEGCQPETTVVYPDPPLGAEEANLFEAIAPTVRLHSFTEWLAEPTGE
jgi:hypothetical protein